MKLPVVSALGALATLAHASVLTPPVLPLVVRNPYLSTWLAGARDAPWEHWPMFYTGSAFGFSVMAAESETKSVYPLLGRPQDYLRADGSYQVVYPKYEGASFDASTTNLTYAIETKPSDKVSGGQVKLTLSFMTPITPTSTFRQSLPASYMTVFVEGDLNISVHVDINGKWVSGDKDSEIKWELGNQHTSNVSATPIKSWKISRRHEQHLTEIDDHAEWGTLYFTGPADAEHQSGEAYSLRHGFAKHKSLTNSVDGTFRRIFDNQPLFAFAKHFKLGSSPSSGVKKDSALFTFSLIQDPVVQFAAARGLTQMRPLWRSYFFTAEEMLQYHYDDFETASALAKQYSLQLASDAFASGAQDYQDIAALSARQVFGATQWSGTPDDPILFLKEISSNGNFQTVDVIFPAFPFFLYTNPLWLSHLLEPLLEHQLSNQYPNDYSMHDLGTHFPNATGHADGKDEYMPVEECGDMLIMGLALINAMRDSPQPQFSRQAPVTARPLDNGAGIAEWKSVDSFGMDRHWSEVETTGESAALEWTLRTYPLWKKWTGYLVRESLIPANQLSTDDFAGWLANQTNLALKGIVGIRAMSDISRFVGNTTEAEEYRSIADDYIEKWQGFGISRDQSHAKLAYTWQGSWTTLYNLYADALLCFHLPENRSRSAGDSGFLVQRSEGDAAAATRKSSLIPDKIYSMQSTWYHNVLQKYGLPLDHRHLYTKSDWEFFAAAVSGKSVRTEILESVAKWLNETVTDLPFTDLYHTEDDGGWRDCPQFKARPVVGGHFAFLALERACGGRAVEGLRFLDNAEPAFIDVAAALRADGRGESVENEKSEEL